MCGRNIFEPRGGKKCECAAGIFCKAPAENPKEISTILRFLRAQEGNFANEANMLFLKGFNGRSAFCEPAQGQIV